MERSNHLGIMAALLAAFAWSLNFVVPFSIGPYSVFDFALIRFGVSGLIGLCFLIMKRGVVRQLALGHWLATAWLAFIGYVGYFMLVSSAAVYSGPVIAPAFLGVVPIVLAIVGNLRQGSVRWRSLLAPITLVSLGLLLVNGAAFTVEGLAPVHSLWIGIPLAIGAVTLWVWFALANQAALAVRPKMTSGVWTALTLVGGGVQMLAFVPVGMAMGLFEFPRLRLGWEIAAPLYIWGVSLAIMASVGGVWAWNIAARNLPVALAAQLIVSETAFGVIGGLIVHSRWPTLAESAGITILIVGIVAAIRVFHGVRSLPSARHVQNS